MIDFLRESTFAVNDVLRSAWHILKNHYTAIAGLCLVSFFTSMISGFLSALFADYNMFISALMALGFIFLYFGIQFAMFKYIMNVIDGKSDKFRLMEVVPSIRRYLTFFVATFLFLLTFVFIFLFVLALVYIIDVIGIKSMLVVQIALTVTVMLSFFIGLRISFFPFFIIDTDAHALQSIRFSFAITRGNFTQLIMLLGVLALFHGLAVYFLKQEDFFLGFIILLFNYALIVPLSAVALTSAYRKMVSEYDGDQENPEFIKNII